MEKFKIFSRDFLKKLKLRFENIENSYIFTCFYLLSIFLISKRILNFFLKSPSKLFKIKKSHQAEWVILTDGCNQKTIELCLNFLKVNSNYKFLLLGFNENKLKDHIKTIKERDKNIQCVCEYVVCDYSDSKIEEFRHKILSNITHFNIKHISVLVLNSDYIVRNYFDKLCYDQIQKLFNFSNKDRIWKDILEKSHLKDQGWKTIIILEGNVFSLMNIPGFQIYYSLKIMTKKYYSKKDSNSLFGVFYLQDDFKCGIHN